jgi:hypothetical protein
MFLIVIRHENNIPSRGAISSSSATSVFGTASALFWSGDQRRNGLIQLSRTMP